MKSLRNSIRKAVLAVPVATSAALGCSSQPTSTTSSASATGTSGASATSGSATSSTGFGSDPCSDCAAQGLVCNPYHTGCVSLGTVASTSGGVAFGTIGTSGSGSLASGATTGSGTSAGASGTAASSSGSSGNDCPSFGLCSPLCDCISSVFRVAPLVESLPANGEVGFCHCEQGCPQLPDGGMGPSHLTGCTGAVSDAGAGDGGEMWDLTCYYYTACNGGRRPRGLVESPPAARSALGSYFAQLAHLEAASVLAFRRMARQLRSVGAPDALVAHARQAAREEVRHARLTRRLAVRFGGKPNPVEAPAPSAATIEELALENAREGCVGETFGAAVASWQALHAADPEIRAVAEALHEDEVGHADLAWEVDAWAHTQLSPDARLRVAQAKEEAIRHLECAPAEGSRELAQVAGLPAGIEHIQLLAALRAEVWASPASC